MRLCIVRSNPRRLQTVASTVFALFALSLSSVASAANVTARLSARSAQSEAAAIKKVDWTANVKVALGNGSWTFTSSGLPAMEFLAANYAVPANPFAVTAAGANVVSSSSVLKDQGYDYTLPLTPAYSSSVTTANQGPIGFLLDGAALYNPYEANHSTVATSDNFVATAHGVTASFLDNCDGHPGPGGQYHYHGLPSCLVLYAAGGRPKVASVTSTGGPTTTPVLENTRTTKRPVILGFAFDGYGIYDNVAMNGSFIRVSTLDACNGLFSPVPGYPHGIYHYVLENVKGPRSSIGCFHGIVSSAYTNALESLLSPGPPLRATSGTNGTPSFATARSLAAYEGEDTLLRTMISLSGHAADC